MMFRPSIKNINGKSVLSVAQCCLFDYELPHVNSFINFNHCNGFIVYRSILHKELCGIGTEKISQIASETWHIAEENFRYFFNDYARKINQIAKKKNTIFKLYEVKPIKRKSKTFIQQSRYLYVKQEEVIKKVYEKEVEDFEFVSF